MLLCVAALGVVAQLKDALNTIWDAPETEGGGFACYRRTYVVSRAGVMALGFLLIVSLLVSAIRAAITTVAGRTFGSEAPLGQAASTLIALGTLTALLDMRFKWFHDVPVRWRDGSAPLSLPCCLKPARRSAPGTSVVRVCSPRTAPPPRSWSS